MEVDLESSNKNLIIIRVENDKLSAALKARDIECVDLKVFNQRQDGQIGSLNTSLKALGGENERHLSAIRAKDLELEDLRALFKQVDT